MSREQLVLPFSIERESLANVFGSAHRELKPRTPLPQIRAEYFPFAGINHTARLNQGHLSVRVSDLFEEAPTEVHHALAVILLAKLYRKKVDSCYQRTYRSYILRTEIQERARMMKSDRGRGARVTEARGRHVDLETLFVDLNSRYFAGGLDKPRISWSIKRSRSILGRYDATHNTIFISRLFDSPRVPEYVTQYVMYHEMLHLKHQTRVKECRMLIHTPEFKQAERRFARYQEARTWLKGL